MQHARFILVGLFLSLFASVAAHAGDFATLNFLGFSKDGKYMAFEEYGVQDGSGFPYSNIYFLDSAKNAYAAPPVTIRLENEQATEQTVRASSRRAAAPLLRKFRIVERNTGQLVVSRLPTDLSLNKYLKDEAGKGQTITFAERVDSMYREGDYELVSNVSESNVKECEYADRPIYRLHLSLKDNKEKKNVILQKDNTLPGSRSCPFEYSVQYVYLYESYIAVFLNTYHIGFEGPDMRYMAVTGKYK